MKQLLLTALGVLLISSWGFSQPNTLVREYQKVFTSYPFSDPDPIPNIGKFYPYYRYDGYTNEPSQMEWKVVELENDFLKVQILPEIGGKIWTAIDKTTGKSFLYDNQVVKFRDVAMRGPWTSGGIEANYGIMGHTPNCATPVDYRILKKDDGSVSCIIGVLDLLTRTSWRLEINLPNDKAYFTTRSFWYNSSELEQPYYTWMNAAIKAKGNLQFIFPGTHHLGHDGVAASWPLDQATGKDLSFYENNNFGTYKSYHIVGERSNFFGGYWHDENFGSVRYSTYGEKPGRKVWIWGLSQEGMIWEDLLTDNDGQYVEIQSGRLFNQADAKSTQTPFKHRSFFPYTADTWTEYWFPTSGTQGIAEANPYGVLNVKQDEGWLKLWFYPLQTLAEELKVTNGSRTVYKADLTLQPMELWADSIAFNGSLDSLRIILGEQKLEYNANPKHNQLNRPMEALADFDWESTYGLFLQGKEKIRQRDYVAGEPFIEKCLLTNPNYLPALVEMASLQYRKMLYEEALQTVIKALRVDTYDPGANYYYGLINHRLGNITDAKDGFDLAAVDMGFRSAANIALASLYLKEGDLSQAEVHAEKALEFNVKAVDAYKLQTIAYRLQGERQKARLVLEKIDSLDPLNHFARFEYYLWNTTEDAKQDFTALVRSEMPDQTYLELAVFYWRLGLNNDAIQVLQLAPHSVEQAYWLAYLTNQPVVFDQLNLELSFPFRAETAEMIEQLRKRADHWMLKYHLGLIHWSKNNLNLASSLFNNCGSKPEYAPFYAARFKLQSEIQKNKKEVALDDLKYAMQLDGNQWRYGKWLIEAYLESHDFAEALTIARDYLSRFPENDPLELLHAKCLIRNGEFKKAASSLQQAQILPNEGATEGRELYREAQLMLAFGQLKKHQYKKALVTVNKALEWPENLGVGKPYSSEIDERLEKWMLYLCYDGLGRINEARQIIDDLRHNHPFLEEDGGHKPAVNDLVTVWAFQVHGDSEAAETLLKHGLAKYPESEIMTWVDQIFRGNRSSASLLENQTTDYRLLMQLTKLN
uniref:DUF5107 domain-containing protein n=1 Tax=uncultured Draconibacterium sp. TaxID=1573823 RepID=UPI003216B326